MGADRWKRVYELFHEAAELPSGDRAAFLKRECGEDGELRKEIEALLAADLTEGALFRLMEDAVGRAISELAPEDDEAAQLVGQRAGPYTITRLIGKGGMGAVYHAVRGGDFRMQAAVKVVKRGFDTDAALSRFRNERRILAELRHPNIAGLLDGGATDNGLPYLVMEFVDGVPLLEYAQPLALRARLQLFRTVCGAVQFAHDHNVLHRDIKPGNILVTKDGFPKLLDFGIAKVLDASPGESGAALTMAGPRPMTPQYASPEQVRGEPLGPASDIYSLGTVLYELLTGQQAQRIETYSPIEIETQVCKRAPAKPSALVKDLGRDLDNIVLKALHKEPGRRYRSAEDLSADIGRYLADRPVLARPDSLAYRGSKFLKRNRVPAAAAALAGVAVLAAMVGVDRFAGRPDAKPKSIAVLPLENLSGDAQHEYFSDGMTDALIDSLARIQGLHVISRTSSMSFKGNKGRVSDIARSLGVRTIAEGSVLRSGDRVRLSMRLIDGPGDRLLWSGSYEGGARELMALDGKVAAAMAHEIGVTLTGAGKARLLRPRNVNLAAFDAYLKGRHQYYSGFERESLDKSIGWFQQALAIDPGYARAYSGLADCYYILSNTHAPPSEMMPKAKWAAEKALQLDDSLAEAHATLAMVRSMYEFNRGAADEGFRRAVELKPSDPVAHIWYSFHLAGMGRLDESLAESKRAAELDPVSPGTNAYNGWPLFFARRYGDLIAQMQPLADANPAFNLPFCLLGEAYTQKGDWGKAIPYLEKSHQMDGLPESLAQLGRAYALAGRSADARKVLQRLTRMSRRRFASAYNFALIHAGLGERDKALDWLEKVEDDRSDWFTVLDVDPRLDSLRSDPRFEVVRRKAGLAQ